MTDNISIPNDFINTILLIILALIGIFSDFFKRFFKREENNNNNNNINSKKLNEISEDIKNIKKDIEKRDLIDAMSEMAEVQNSTIQILAQIKNKDNLCSDQQNH